MTSAQDTADPKGLIRESYRIDGSGAAECRSILIDWALSLPEGTEQGTAIRALLARYGDGAPDHPMTALLREGLAVLPARGRRRGRAGRLGQG